MNSKLAILLLIVAFIWSVSAEKKARTATPMPAPVQLVATPTATQTPTAPAAATAAPSATEPPTKTPPPLPTPAATAVAPYPVAPTLEAYP